MREREQRRRQYYSQTRFVSGIENGTLMVVTKTVLQDVFLFEISDCPRTAIMANRSTMLPFTYFIEKTEWAVLTAQANRNCNSAPHQASLARSALERSV